MTFQPKYSLWHLLLTEHNNNTFSKSVNHIQPNLGLSLMLKTSLGECTDNVSASNTFNLYHSFGYGGPRENWLSECRVPCNQTVYELNMQMHHQNNIGSQGDGLNDLVGKGVLLTIYLANFVVEERIETLIYDTGNFLAQAGGNLGLFLGFSCLSLLFAIIKLFKKALNYLGL